MSSSSERNSTSSTSVRSAWYRPNWFANLISPPTTEQSKPMRSDTPHLPESRREGNRDHRASAPPRQESVQQYSNYSRTQRQGPVSSTPDSNVLQNATGRNPTSRATSEYSGSASQDGRVYVGGSEQQQSSLSTHSQTLPDFDQLVTTIHSLRVDQKQKLINALFDPDPSHLESSAPASSSGDHRRNPVSTRDEPWDQRITAPLFEKLHGKLRCPYQTQAHELYSKLQESYSTCRSIQGEASSCSEALKAEKIALRNFRDQAAKEVATLNAKISELETIHVRSVNEIGTGLEPISDQTFSSSFEDYHDNVYQWCRRNFRGRKKAVEIKEQLQKLMNNRCEPESQVSLTLSRAAEIMIWDTIESWAICPWFPVDMPGKENHGINLDSLGVGFQRLDLPNHQQKIDFWRCYTACLAVQSSDFETCIKNHVTEMVLNLLPRLADLVLPNQDSGFDGDSLYEILHPIVITAAQLKCQRGHFDIENVKVGSIYKGSRMEDVTNMEIDEQQKQVVKVVLSDGIIKRAYHLAEGRAIGRACKARVMIGPVDK